MHAASVDSDGSESYSCMKPLQAFQLYNFIILISKSNLSHQVTHEDYTQVSNEFEMRHSLLEDRS